MTLRLGHIDYLNCLPVYHPLQSGQVPCPVDVIPGPPARINQLFREGLVDVAPISSIEYARGHREAVLLPDLAIAADGRVRSILLFAKVTPSHLAGRRVALTTSSATSVVLTRILLLRCWGVEADYFSAHPNLDEMMAEADACLLIGDDALLGAQAVAGRRGSGRPGSAWRVIDLGEVWRQFSGHPMVYGLFAARAAVARERPQELLALANALRTARDLGRQNLPAIARLGAASRRLDPNLVLAYLEHIDHTLPPACQRGLLAYYQAAVSVGELAVVPPLKFWPPAKGVEASDDWSLAARTAP